MQSFIENGVKAIFSRFRQPRDPHRLEERYPDLPERTARLSTELFQDSLFGYDMTTAVLFQQLVFHALRSRDVTLDDENALLDQVRDLAWIGYRDMPLLIQSIESDDTFPQPKLFQEVERQKAEWLLLPIVSAISRRLGKPVPDKLRSERLFDGYRSKQMGMMLSSFVMGKSKVEEQLRGTMIVALFLLPQIPGAASLETYLTAIRDELRVQYHDRPTTADRAMTKKVNPVAAKNARVCADELSDVVGGALWIEAIFVIEKYLYGDKPPNLDHLFEMRIVDR